MVRRYLYFVLWYGALAYWFIRRPYSYGAGVIVEDGNKALLIRHSYGHRELWGLPGGHKKPTESYETAAVRELNEEVGLDIPIKKLGEIKVIEDFRRATEAVFLGQYNGQAINLEKSEIAEHGWFTLDDLPNRMFASTKQSIDLYLRTIR